MMRFLSAISRILAFNLDGGEIPNRFSNMFMIASVNSRT